MTQEDKELLLRDLCARLLYGVVMNVTEPGEDRVNFNCFIGPDIIKEITSEIGHFKYKPYLRPMSSITEEEKKEFNSLINGVEERCINAYGKGGYTLAFTEVNDWLNANHFDYRGLIPIGLAIEAPEGMYK